MEGKKETIMKILQLPVGELAANCYLVFSNGECAAIDPGGEPEKITAKINEAGVILKLIILTHHHFDHAQAAEDLKKISGGRILMHEAEKNFTTLKADGFLADGDEITMGGQTLKVMHTPGHTKGSICLSGENAFFSGDTLFEHGFGRTDYPGGSGSAMRDSLVKIYKTISPGVTIYPGHGAPFQFSRNSFPSQ